MDQNRTKINEMIEEHTDTVPFMKKVQSYADEQIDKRLFKSVKVMLRLAIGWTAALVIAGLTVR